jgi:hypothetical protein
MDFLQSEPGTYLAIQNAPDLISKLKVRSVQNFGISYMISLLLKIASSFEAVKSTINFTCAGISFRGGSELRHLARKITDPDPDVRILILFIYMSM